jgi:hypothetical protein
VYKAFNTVGVEHMAVRKTSSPPPPSRAAAPARAHPGALHLATMATCVQHIYICTLEKARCNVLEREPRLGVVKGSLQSAEKGAPASPRATLFPDAVGPLPPGCMQHPDGELITGERLTVLFAGPTEHQEKCAEIVEAVGFIPEYVGPIR